MEGEEHHTHTPATPPPWAVGAAIPPLHPSSEGRIDPARGHSCRVEGEAGSKGLILRGRRAGGWQDRAAGGWAQAGSSESLLRAEVGGWPHGQPGWWPRGQPAQQSMPSLSHQAEGPSVPKYLSPKLPEGRGNRVRRWQHWPHHNSTPPGPQGSLGVPRGHSTGLPG